MRINNPTISLVIPVYGVRDYIAEFAESVFGQSYPHLQFIFVNDGSKDDTMQVLDSVIKNRYPYLQDRIVIVNKENQGLPAARKTGMDYVTGDYVYHVDPDDWLSPDSLARVAEKIQESGSDIVYFHYVKEYENRSSVKKEGSYTGADRASYVRNMYNHRAYGTLCNKCIKTSLFRDHQIFVPSYGHAEDCCISVQVAGYSSRIERLDEIIL